MTRSRLFAAAGALALTALVAACSSSSHNSTPASVAPPTAASGQVATIGLEPVGNLGKILVDSRGRTLYLFQKDSRNMSACSGACATAWPPLRDSGKPEVGAGANSSLVETIPRSDGKPQVTYGGHPLYLFDGDNAPGQANGQGVTAFGGGWFALSSSGSAVSGTGSNSGGGNGY